MFESAASADIYNQPAANFFSTNRHANNSAFESAAGAEIFNPPAANSSLPNHRANNLAIKIRHAKTNFVARVNAEILRELVNQHAANQIPLDGHAPNPRVLGLESFAVENHRHIVGEIGMAEPVDSFNPARLLLSGVERVRVINDLQAVFESASEFVRQNLNVRVGNFRAANRKILLVAGRNDFNFIVVELGASQDFKAETALGVDVAIRHEAIEILLGRVVENLAQINRAENLAAAQKANAAVHFAKIPHGVAPKIFLNNSTTTAAKNAIICSAMDNKIYKIARSEYVASAVKAAQYPADNLPEIAFIGRSNVGKSSLINSLTGRKNLARISQTPGKTQTINFFRATLNLEPPQEFFLVDLPGYGYAKVSKADRKFWAKFIEEYLLTRRQLKFVCLLVDLRHPPMNSDSKMLAWLVENNLPVLVVATKADKLGRNERMKNLSAMQKIFALDELPILPFSSKTGEGRPELLGVIAESLLESPE